MHVHTRFWSDVPAHSARPARREASATVAETWNEFSNVRRGALQHGRRRELRLRAGRPQRCRPRVHNGFRNTMSSDASACTALCGDAEHVNTDGVTSIGCEAKGPSVAEHFNTDGAASIGREAGCPSVGTGTYTTCSVVSAFRSVTCVAEHVDTDGVASNSRGAGCPSVAAGPCAGKLLR